MRPVKNFPSLFFERMMNLKRILVLNGSCRYQGSTQFFLESLFNNLDSKEYKVQYLFCRDFNKMRLNPNTLYDISYTQRNGDSKIYELEEMILKSDCFVVASPVYMHNISSDLKLILEKLSTWSHTLRLDGKPCLVLSTCNSNGNTTVTGYLCKVLTSMGGKVIANCNALEYQLRDKKWVTSVRKQIQKRINDKSLFYHSSSSAIEEVFIILKKVIELREKSGDESEEVMYWKTNNLINFETFQEYLTWKGN